MTRLATYRRPAQWPCCPAMPTPRMDWRRRERRISTQLPRPPASGTGRPRPGRKAEAGKTDHLHFGGPTERRRARRVGAGVEEAATAIGWTLKIIDGQGSVPQQTAAIGQAMALRPDGIVLGTIDAVGQRATIQRATELGIKVVGWHSSPKPGPMDSPALFANITTPPELIAQTAADYVIVKSDGHAQVAIMRNSETLIGRMKGDLMRQRIEACTELQPCCRST